jgi:thiosulfate dehydrogenase (quinone) large subunit
LTELDPFTEDKGVILGFLESIKYVGHLWPISFLRWFVCFQYFGMATYHVRSGLLEHPYLSEQLRIKIESLGVLNNYLGFWIGFVQDYWLAVSYVIVCTEFVIAISYLLGYLVRPVALWASFVALHLFWLVESPNDFTQLYLMSIHLTFCLLGAGRCLGLDYYFYKSRRGLLW